MPDFKAYQLTDAAPNAPWLTNVDTGAVMFKTVVILL